MAASSDEYSTDNEYRDATRKRKDHNAICGEDGKTTLEYLPKVFKGDGICLEGEPLQTESSSEELDVGRRSKSKDSNKAGP